MRIRIIHSADWQIGARFRQFGEKAGLLRAARLATLRRALACAARVKADAFLIAGDLFEDNAIDAGTVGEVCALFREFPTVRVFIVPGNHDPFTGPGSVWGRPPFCNPPANVTVFTQPAAVWLGAAVVADAGGGERSAPDGANAPSGDGPAPSDRGAWLFANPLTQKRSTQDPSLPLMRLARETPAGAIRIGLTHGALAIDGKHQPDDFPIALDAATRAGLDYLAVGHWHSAFRCDGNRLVMPGTPEPTDFGEHTAGCVQRVEIDAPDAPPRITPVPVAGLRWETWEFDFIDVESSRERILRAIASLREPAPGRGENENSGGASATAGVDAAAAVVRVVLKGTASPAHVDEIREWLDEELRTKSAGTTAAAGDRTGNAVAALDVQDRTVPGYSDAELRELTSRHPLLAGVLADLHAAHSQVGGVGAGGGAAPLPGGLEPAPLADGALSFRELSAICAEARINSGVLDAEFFALAERILFGGLREADAHAH